MTEPHTAVRDTSRAAARSLTDSALSHMRLRVYGFVRDRAQGATCDETEAGLGLRHQTASAPWRTSYGGRRARERAATRGTACLASTSDAAGDSLRRVACDRRTHADGCASAGLSSVVDSHTSEERLAEPIEALRQHSTVLLKHSRKLREHADEARARSAKIREAAQRAYLSACNRLAHAEAVLRQQADRE